MKSKISVKTILLFTALFILGTMILGFYSCSGNTTPVSPQLIDEFTDEALVPADVSTTINNGDGTITIVDENGDMTTITTPGTTITMEDGTTIITYTVIMGEDGNLTIIDPREVTAAGSGNLVDDLIYLEFSSFVQDGELWTGNVRVVNNSSSLLQFPRAVFGNYAGTGLSSQSSEFSQVNFIDILVNPDIYFGLYRNDAIQATAYPAIFIADEDENYTVDPAGFAEHEITIRLNPETVSEQYFEVNLAYQMAPVQTDTGVLDDEIRKGVPLGIDIEFVEFDEVSRITITVDVDLDFDFGIMPVRVEESLYGDIYTFTFSGFNGFEQPVYTGVINWNPIEDGPINVMAYFPQGLAMRAYSDSFMDFTTLTPE